MPLHRFFSTVSFLSTFSLISSVCVLCSSFVHTPSVVHWDPIWTPMATKLFASQIDDGLRNVEITSKPIQKIKKKSKVKGANKSKASKASASGGSAESISKKKTKAAKKRKKSTGEPPYWTDSSHGTFVIPINDPESNSQASEVRLRVRGKPRPLVRHRTSRGIVYNPSAKYQESFRSKVQELLSRSGYNLDLDRPVFSAEDFLHMSLIFRMNRPKKHFVGNKPGPERMRKDAPSPVSSIRTDIDNLSKFVLDSMNTILFDDDRQIMSLRAIKLLDDDGLCEGSIELHIRCVSEADIYELP